LFTAACCRRLWPHLSREAHRVVEAAERYADRMDDEDELVKAVKVFTGWQGKLTLETWLRARRLFHPALPDFDTATTAMRLVLGAVWGDLGVFGRLSLLSRSVKRGQRTAERRAQCSLLRCITGNPSHTLPSVSFSEDVRGVAEATYETQDSDHYLVLADALEEDQLLHESWRRLSVSHLRQGGLPHAKGCHVVDWITGRE